MSNGGSRFTIHADGKVSSSNITKDGIVQLWWQQRNLEGLYESQRLVEMDVATLIHFFNALQVDEIDAWSYGAWRGGTWRLARVIKASMELAGHTLPDDEEIRLEDTLIALDKCIRTLWSNLEDFLLEYTYISLRNRRIRHEDAASMASAALGQMIKPDAWRMRIKKWAKGQGLPPVEQRLRNSQT